MLRNSELPGGSVRSPSGEAPPARRDYAPAVVALAIGGLVGLFYVAVLPAIGLLIGYLIAGLIALARMVL